VTGKTSRRRFLAGTLAAACVPAARRVRAAPQTDVVVIGAGLSGLNAALLLESQGMQVTVLEGSARLGGRVHTADGVRLRPEYGASQIGRSYARVIGTARRFGVKLVPEDRDLLPFAAHLRGRWVTAEDWPHSDLNPLPDKLRATPAARAGSALISQFNTLDNAQDWLDPKFASLDVSMSDLLRQHDFPAPVIELASLTTPSMSEVSVLALMQEEERGRLDRAFGTSSLAKTSNIEGGTSRLIEAMAAGLKRPVVRRKVVARIDMQDAGKRGGGRTDAGAVRVECLDSSTFGADFVIAALPFFMLKRIDVRPAFTGIQLEAIQTMPTLGTTRAYLAIREPFWHADGIDPSFFSDGSLEMFWAIDNHRNGGEYQGMFVLTGDRAARFDALAPADAPGFLLEELARIRPASRGKVEVLTWNSWSAEPLIGCCRHIYAPGQITRFARQMIEPWGRLHLAGEHTRRNDFGMEAAMESGERAALEILSAAG